MMKQVGGFTGLAGAVVLMGMVGVLQAGCVSWDSEPDPEADAIAEKYADRLDSDTFFEAFNDSDFDAKTVTRQNSVTVTLEEDEGRSGCEWLIVDRGIDSYFVEGMSAAAKLSAWNWKTEGEGDYGAISYTSGAFIFDDGRDDEDPRYDRKLVAGASTAKVIPDMITTQYSGCLIHNYHPHDPMPENYRVDSYQFKHTLFNSDFPEIKFTGMRVREELVNAFCFPNPCPDDFLEELKSGANFVWTVDENNTLPECDRHGTGSVILNAYIDPVAPVFEVLVFQVFRIDNWGWPEKLEQENLTHAIGQGTGGGLFNLGHIHTIFYSIDPNTTKYWTAQKNGLGPPSYTHFSIEECLSAVVPGLCPIDDYPYPQP